jgi:hypothetical protein
MRREQAVLILVCASLMACDVDVLLGSNASPDIDAGPEDAAPKDAEPRDAAVPDAMLDASLPDASLPDAAARDYGPIGIVSSGTYTLSFSATSTVMCGGSLSGLESIFAGTAPATVGLITGMVEVTTSTVIIVSGAPIESAYGLARMTLTQDSMLNTPPYVYGMQVDRNQPGPNGTTEAARVLLVDTSIQGQTPDGFGAIAGVGYLDSTRTGTCVLEFMGDFAH